MSINVDVSPVDDEEEALLLMFHHLKLAATYFEATPSVINDVPETFHTSAMWAWLQAMDDLYPREEAD